MNKRLIGAAASVATGALAVVIPLAPANAGTSWQCSESGHYLTTTIYYTTGTTNHTWQYLTYKLTGEGTGGKSNWSASFNDGTGIRNYYANNANDLDQDTLYTEGFTDFSTPKSRAEKWGASAVFDTRFGDNRCSGSITL